jgi:hypothetical protein
VLCRLVIDKHLEVWNADKLSSDEERAVQVAQMGRIYTMCTQVVVYLGPDVAPLLPDGKYPRRARLQEFGSMDVEKVSGVRGVKELLQRRYFSRLWVVQELILSPRVVIRIGDVDFQSDGATSGHLWWSESDGLAAWVQHTSKGAPLDLDLLQVMRLTFSTACADPRDRLFGIMGIISDESWLLQPDYSRPVQEVFIGLFAYLVIVKGMRNLLTYASGVYGPPTAPSWVPDWTLWHNWFLVFVSINPLGGRRGGSFSDQVMSVLTTDIPPSYESAFTLPLQIYRRPTSHGLEAIFHIHTTTGALRARMVRLLTVTSVPKKVGVLDGAVERMFEARYGKHSIYLTSVNWLDKIVEPGSDHLYLFPLEQRDGIPSLCILRGTDDPGRDAMRLVATCDEVFFCSGSPKDNPEPREEQNGSQLVSRRRDSPGHSKSPEERSDEGYVTSWIALNELYWTLSDVIKRTQAWLETSLDLDAEVLLFAPKYRDNLDRKDISQVYYLALLEEDFEKLLAAYLGYVSEECAAEIQDDFLIFTVTYEKWVSSRQVYQPGVLRDWIVWEEPEQDPNSGLPGSRPVTARMILARAEVRGMLYSMHQDRVPWLARAAVRRTGQPLEQMLSRKPTEADYLVRVPTCAEAEELMDDGVGYGTEEYVNIF